MLKRLIVAIVAFAAVFGLLFVSRTAATSPDALASVLVEDDSGHGSGVHIGNGYVLTAAHVVEDKATMQVEDSTGRKQTGTVLWANKIYDVALIHIDDYIGVQTARLNCTPTLSVGAPVQAVGNPLDLTFIRAWGHVASDVRARGPWKLSFIADMTLAPGMSGGPVYDEQGAVVGLAVGIPVMSIGFGKSGVAMSYVVPSMAVCGLLAR